MGGEIPLLFHKSVTLASPSVCPLSLAVMHTVLAVNYIISPSKPASPRHLKRGSREPYLYLIFILSQQQDGWSCQLSGPVNQVEVKAFPQGKAHKSCERACVRRQGTLSWINKYETWSKKTFIYDDKIKPPISHFSFVITDFWSLQSVYPPDNKTFQSLFLLSPSTRLFRRSILSAAKASLTAPKKFW